MKKERKNVSIHSNTDKKKCSTTARFHFTFGYESFQDCHLNGWIHWDSMDPDVNENVRTTFTYRRLFYIRITSFIWGKRASKWKRDRVEKERKWEWEKIGSSKWEWWCLKRTNATARNLQGRIEMNIFNKNINTNNAEAKRKIYDFDAE